ncbi:unnamed protein product [Linum trigynum]|uniref:Uncharacterized protein n=1 Tax=Linum trigynum TaxID=586398 RepID=A0AAV2CG47_9ROSI
MFEAEQKIPTTTTGEDPTLHDPMAHPATQTQSGGRKGKEENGFTKDETTNLEKSLPSRSAIGTHQIANSGSYNQQTLIRRTKNRRKRHSSTGNEETKLHRNGN